MPTHSAFLDLAPIRAAHGEMRLPGSKSVSIRAMLLASLAEGETRLTGLLDSDDTRVMREALRACGVPLRDEGEAGWRVRGAVRFPLREAEIFVGNSGLSIRTLVAVLAFMDGRYRLSGVPRMHERPIGDLVLLEDQDRAFATLAAVGDLGGAVQVGRPPASLAYSSRSSTHRRKRLSGGISSAAATSIR